MAYQIFCILFPRFIEVNALKRDNFFADGAATMGNELALGKKTCPKED